MQAKLIDSWNQLVQTPATKSIAIWAEILAPETPLPKLGDIHKQVCMGPAPKASNKELR